MIIHRFPRAWQVLCADQQIAPVVVRGPSQQRPPGARANAARKTFRVPLQLLSRARAACAAPLARRSHCLGRERMLKTSN
jgi:hypothetical protein